MSLWIQYQNDPRLPKTDEVLNNVAVVQPLGIQVCGVDHEDARRKAIAATEASLQRFQQSLDRLKKYHDSASSI